MSASISFHPERPPRLETLPGPGRKPDCAIVRYDLGPNGFIGIFLRTAPEARALRELAAAAAGFLPETDSYNSREEVMPGALDEIESA